MPSLTQTTALDEAQETSVYDAMAKYTTGIFSQADVQSALADIDLPSASQEQVMGAVAILDAARDGACPVDEIFNQLPPPSQTGLPRLEQLKAEMRSAATLSQALAARGRRADSTARTGASEATDGEQEDERVEAAAGMALLSATALARTWDFHTGRATTDEDRAETSGSLRHRGLGTSHGTWKTSVGVLGSGNETDVATSAAARQEQLTGGTARSDLGREQLTGGTARSAWALKNELQGGRAQYYRGPLSSQEVQILLNLDLSENARLALSGGLGDGYLSYFHFMGMFDKKGTVQERWQCRSCHSNLHAVANKIGNLGTHLYGTVGGKRIRPGCLDERANNPAECIPIPPRDAKGTLMRQGASKPIQRKPVRRKRKADGQAMAVEQLGDQGASASMGRAVTEAAAATANAATPPEIAAGNSVASEAAPALTESASAMSTTSASAVTASTRAASATTESATGLASVAMTPCTSGSESRLRRVKMRTQPFFYVVTSATRKVLDATYPVSALLGWTRHDLRDEMIDELIHPDDKMAVIRMCDPMQDDPPDLHRALAIPDETGDWGVELALPGDRYPTNSKSAALKGSTSISHLDPKGILHSINSIMTSSQPIIIPSSSPPPQVVAMPKDPRPPRQPTVSSPHRTPSPAHHSRKGKNRLLILSSSKMPRPFSAAHVVNARRALTEASASRASTSRDAIVSGPLKIMTPQVTTPPASQDWNKLVLGSASPVPSPVLAPSAGTPARVLQPWQKLVLDFSPTPPPPSPRPHSVDPAYKTHRRSPGMSSVPGTPSPPARSGTGIGSGLLAILSPLPASTKVAPATPPARPMSVLGEDEEEEHSGMFTSTYYTLPSRSPSPEWGAPVDPGARVAEIAHVVVDEAMEDNAPSSSGSTLTTIEGDRCDDEDRSQDGSVHDSDVDFEVDDRDPPSTPITLTDEEEAVLTQTTDGGPEVDGHAELLNAFAHPNNTWVPPPGIEQPAPPPVDEDADDEDDTDSDEEVVNASDPDSDEVTIDEYMDADPPSSPGFAVIPLPGEEVTDDEADDQEPEEEDDQPVAEPVKVTCQWVHYDGSSCPLKPWAHGQAEKIPGLRIQARRLTNGVIELKHPLGTWLPSWYYKLNRAACPPTCDGCVDEDI
ncbi:hypothetical protein OC835_003017 [Tilletia horrida]|nr:hypothetical protein OC835_003017 [Tilletia horrida]